MNISCCEHPLVSGWRRNERARLMRYASEMSSRRLPAADGALIQIVDAALADATRRSRMDKRNPANRARLDYVGFTLSSPGAIPAAHGHHRPDCLDHSKRPGALQKP